MEEKSAAQIRLEDPLSDVTRKERRSLLAVSAIAIIMAKTGLVPAKISGFGIEFTQADQSTFLFILGVIVMYLFFAFTTYALSDFLAWRIAFNRQRLKLLRDQQEAAKEESDQTSNRKLIRLAIASRPTSFVRAVFEFLLPIIVAIYSILLLWT